MKTIKTLLLLLSFSILSAQSTPIRDYLNVMKRSDLRGWIFQHGQLIARTMVQSDWNMTLNKPLFVGSSNAMAYLEYSINSGTTWLLPSQNGNSSSVGVDVAVQLTNGQTGVLAGVIPANALTRIRIDTTGTGSVLSVTGQETY